MKAFVIAEMNLLEQLFHLRRTRNLTFHENSSKLSSSFCEAGKIKWIKAKLTNFSGRIFLLKYKEREIPIVFFFISKNFFYSKTFFHSLKNPNEEKKTTRKRIVEKYLKMMNFQKQRNSFSLQLFLEKLNFQNDLDYKMNVHWNNMYVQWFFNRFNIV